MYLKYFKLKPSSACRQTKPIIDFLLKAAVSSMDIVFYFSNNECGLHEMLRQGPDVC